MRGFAKLTEFISANDVMRPLIDVVGGKRRLYQTQTATERDIKKY